MSSLFEENLEWPSQSSVTIENGLEFHALSYTVIQIHLSRVVMKKS
jgi:hypothetical protein